MSCEGGQDRAAEAGRRGCVGHVEVFRMDGVGTSIVGRPRRLPADRRARPTYTLIWEEPSKGLPRTVGESERLQGASLVNAGVLDRTPSGGLPLSGRADYSLSD